MQHSCIQTLTNINDVLLSSNIVLNLSFCVVKYFYYQDSYPTFAKLIDINRIKKNSHINLD